MIHHDVIVVGGGLAGLRAAIEAKRAGVDVAVLSQVHPGRSHSGAAQGGINAALANHPDGARRHLGEARVRHGQGRRLPGRPGRRRADDQGRHPGHLRDGPLGLPLQPLRRRHASPSGRSAAPAIPRTCYGADKTGHYLLHTLVEQAVQARR